MHSSRFLPSAALGLAALACCGAAGAKGLYPTQFTDTLNSPGAVVIADVNGDGFPDLVEIGADQTIAVLLNKGDGTFRAPVEYYVTLSAATSSTGPQPKALAVADVNGDGKPDIVAVNTGDSTVSVLLGNGDGTFQAQTAEEAAKGKGKAAPSYAVGQGVTSLAVADLNGDGKPDIVTADFTDNTVSVLLNKGNGTFAARSTMLVGNGPDFVTVADLNKDGKADIVVSDSGDNSFNVLLNKGNGAFTLQPEIQVGPLPAQSTLQMTVVGDFNNDGNLDVISTNTDPNSDVVMFYPGNGNGGFGAPHAIVTGLRTLNLQAAALHGTGTTLDLVAGNFAAGIVHVLFGTGKGTFVSSTQYPAFGLDTALANQPFAVGDVNGDGKPDIATVNATGGFVQVMYNDGTAHFHPDHSYNLGATPADVQTADLNGDGHMDVAELNAADGTLGVRLGNGDGTFQALQTYPVGSHPVRLTLADVNGDGIMDAITANNDGSSGTVSVLIGVGDGTFQPAQSWPAGANPVDVAVADMDQDGKPDIVVANATVNTVSILYEKSFTPTTATFSAPKAFPAGSQINALAAGDVDRDGFPDVVTVGGNLAVLRNDGKGGLLPIVLDKNGVSQDSYAAIGNRVILKDVNDDHQPDILIADSSNSEIIVLLGNRLGYFTRPVPFLSATCGNPNNLAAADLNGDGHVDVVVSCAGSSAVGVLLGNGRGTFISSPYAAEVDPRGVAIADFDEDGHPDVVVINGGSDNMNVLLQIPGVVASDNRPITVNSPLFVQGSVTPVDGIFEASDPDGDPLTYALIDPPAFGTLSFDSTTGDYAYLADPGYVGSDSMSFEVSDGVKISKIATVSINVKAAGGSGGGKHGFLGALALPMLPLLGLLAFLRRRRG